MYSNAAFTVTLGMDFEMDFAPAAATDITGWTLQCTISSTRSQDDADGTAVPALVTVTPTTVSAAAGTFKVVVTAAQCLTFGVGDVYVSVWRIDSGLNDEIATGVIRVLPTARRLP